MARGVLKLAEHAPEALTMAGHAVPIPGGSFIGAGAGIGVKAAANKLVGKSGLAAVEKRIRKLQ